MKSLGEIDLLVNNAGTVVRTSFLDVTKEELDRSVYFGGSISPCPLVNLGRVTEIDEGRGLVGRRLVEAPQ